MQSGISVSGSEITGTLKYLSSGQLVTDWGPGYFLALKFTDIPEGLDYNNVKVGLLPSQGSGLVNLDGDYNGVFKITDKDYQKFRVEITDGTYTKTQTFNLKGLELAR